MDIKKFIIRFVIATILLASPMFNSTVVSSPNNNLIFQQPYEISVITESHQSGNNRFECKVYPNPATNILTLMLIDSEINAFSYKLFDISGRLHTFSNLSISSTNIFMDNLKSSIYILKVYKNSIEVKSFRIVKN